MTDQSLWRLVDNVVIPIGRRKRSGYRANMTHPGIGGWQLTVDTAWTDAGVKIRRLELRALVPGADITGEQIRLMKPRDLLGVVANEWVLEDDSIVVPEPLPSGSRSRRTDEYLFELAEATMALQGSGVASVRSALSQRFGRSSSQVRDDLNRATQKGFLAKSQPGARARVEGERLVKERQRRAARKAELR